MTYSSVPSKMLGSVIILPIRFSVETSEILLNYLNKIDSVDLRMNMRVLDDSLDNKT